MERAAEFCLLGPLVVRYEGAVAPVTSGRQRSVLAALLLSHGRTVTLDELAEVLWGSQPPPSARVAVQNYVMRLRRTLGGAGARIGTRPGGYAIHLAPGELDMAQFGELLRAARAAASEGSWEQAAAKAAGALALWRGEPLEDVASDLLSLRELPRLAEMRLQALEVRIEADVRLGGHAAAIAELRRLATAHPMRERLHELLMLALYQDGRPGDALAAYRQARRVLVDELGAEPGPGLRELQQRILSGDPVPAGRAPARSASAGAPPVPSQLPAAVPHFTGRAAELATLTRRLDAATTGAPGMLLISAIGGTAGVGKTALAVHWAHRVADRFPDGQLYVNLRGYDRDQPMPAAEALAGFLRALGMPGPEIPADLAERAASYRGLLAGRRMLVLLDNAGDAEQVRPLLPASRGCAVVVTSRDRLSGLVARDGAARVDLGLLPLPDATALLRMLIGRRAQAEPEATTALAVQCCRLPLALRVAAELATARPADSLASLTAELAGQRQRLDLLDADGDTRTAVRAVFSWSCRCLDAAAARAFRLAGLHPGPGLDSHGLAALTGGTAAEATRLLARLARGYLIQPTGPGRWAMHDLLRGYAASLAAEVDGQDECRAAITRLFDYYLYTAMVAVSTLYPAERHRLPPIPRPATACPRPADPVAARAWLDAERATLTAVASQAAGHGWPSHATRLSRTLFRYLDSGGYFSAASIVHGCACRAARRAGDRGAQAAALNSLGVVVWRQGRYSRASACFRRALALCRETGDRSGEAQALNRLGLVDFQQGRYRQAAVHHEQALLLCRETGDRPGEARALGNLGGGDWRQGHYQRATAYLQQALTLHRRAGDRSGEAEATGILGIIALRQGRYPEAAGRFERALALCRQTGDRIGAADALIYLGVTALRQGCRQEAAGQLRSALALCRQTGDRPTEAYALASLGEAALHHDGPEQAADYFGQALALCRQTGDLFAEAQARNGLGEALLAVGQPDEARAEHAAALTLASATSDKYQHACAHQGLGHVFRACGDSDQCRRHWQEAIALFTALGAAETGQLRAALDGLDGSQAAVGTQRA